ncbi:MAG: prepilin peptidase [Erysipelothrix sp.]|nr:prepilin peptidase [Erysipelothrix sp.]
MELIYSCLFFIFGIIIGSFLNVCIYRIPREESIVITGSHCPHCGHFLKPYDNIPLISYLFLGGKCRHCKKPISLRYPLVELITGLLFVANYLQLGLTFHLLLNLILTCTLIIITFIDIDTLIINDRFHVIISALAIMKLVTSPDLLQSSLIGAFIISIPFLLIAGLTGGLGGGDVKLMAVAGLYLGWQNVLVSFFIASITGGLYAIYLILFKKQGRKAEMPFGPFLCLGILIASLYATELINWYMGLM